MLKIKDNVDLKILEHYGFKILYDVDTGKIDKLVQEYGYPYCDSVKRPFINIIKITRKSITIPKRFWRIDAHVPANPCNQEIFFETLYDLIKDGIIEKV